MQSIDAYYDISVSILINNVAVSDLCKQYTGIAKNF